MSPAISLIVPVFNNQKYLRNCIESVLSQNYENFELLLIDDGSTDGSSEICDELAKRDPRILVFHKKNGGASSARNLGIKKSSGQYIGFIDSDDFVDNNYLKQLIKGKDSDLSAVSLVCEYADKKVLHQFKISGELNGNKLVPFFNIDLPNLIALSPCCKLYRKDILTKYNISFDESIDFAEDAIFNLKYYSHVNSIFCVDTPLYHYRMTGNGLTSNQVNHHSQYAKTSSYIIDGIEKLKHKYPEINQIDIISTILLQFYLRELKYAFARPSITEMKICLKEISECENFQWNMTNYPKGVIGINGKIINYLLRNKFLHSLCVYLRIIKLAGKKL